MGSGIVFNIQRYSLHDGPGIRTTVFLKGCPLRCRWCCNPESQSFAIEPAFDARKCINCGGCNKSPSARRELSLIPQCPSGAIFAYGKEYTAAEILDAAERDAVFYGADGGLTLSGGEPLAQPDFAVALLEEAKRRRINTAIESCAHVPWDVLRAAAALLDSIFFDIKSLESEKHRAFTGVGNELILENFRRLCTAFPHKPITVRCPAVPGFNAEEIPQIAAFARGVGSNVRFQAMEYHTLGAGKYVMLGRKMLDFPEVL
ncbi:MAG: glycyl-radical enzyme activating protein [Oscillospiraceae bacterium]|jgi:pyruvate formate lyase activating enzyme|nr:glycyl-radical enzyme activating protein [Oscillospiraceae bacterium]